MKRNDVVEIAGSIAFLSLLSALIFLFLSL